tara:strand:- start:869 stop:2134 length:1266 start_codon:yes stop_codon:yes gene_type:complete
MTWTTVKIGDVAQVKGGKRLPKGMSVQDMVTEYPYVRVTDFDPDGVNLNSVKFISKEAHKATSRYIINCTDVYISIAGTIGLVGIVPKQLDGANLTENAAKICEISEDINPQFLMYFLRSRIGQGLINAQVVGTSQPKLALFRIKDIEIPAPEKTVQDEIASVLSKYDNLIENNNRRIAILEDMAQSLYREWFVNFRYPNHEDNLDADGNPKLIDSPLGQIPEGWEVVVLENLCNKITDGAHKSPKSVDVGVPMASVKDMHDFGINASKCRQISYEDYEDLKRQDSVVKANDILVAKDGSYLKHTFVVEKELEMALLSSIAIIRPNEKVKPHWLAYCLRSPLVKERMKNYVSGAAIPRIILKDFRKFNLFIPPQELMDEWNSIVEEMVKQCWNLVSRNENLKQQRDMMLPKLISGQIELKD